MGLLGIFLSLILLMYLAYRGINVLILAPLLAMLAVLMSGGLPVLATYTQVFMKSLGGYVITYFPLFLLGAIFGKVHISLPRPHDRRPGSPASPLLPRGSGLSIACSPVPVLRLVTAMAGTICCRPFPRFTTLFAIWFVFAS